MKSNISTFSDFKLYLFSAVLFAILKTHSCRGAGLVPANTTGTVTGRNRNAIRNRNPSRILIWTRKFQIGKHFNMARFNLKVTRQIGTMRTDYLGSSIPFKHTKPKLYITG